MSGYIPIKRSNKSLVFTWMWQHCYGHVQAMTRTRILKELPMKIGDRTLRAYLSELKHEGHIASHPEKGYWSIPTYTKDPEEIKWAKRSWLDMKAKAMDMLRDCDQQIKNLDARAGMVNGVELLQADLFEV